MNLKQLSQLYQACEHTIKYDQIKLRRRIRQFQQRVKKQQELDLSACQKLVNAVEQAMQHYKHRCDNLPKVSFPDDLPIAAHHEKIADAIKNNQVVIIAGDTGSGKTTQIPKICLDIGRGVNGFIGCTQPRRIAARTVANRIAEELDSELGQTVGYKVRFHDQMRRESYIKLMTDGILLAETQGDRYFNQYDTLIIDEAHERSLNIDFILGYLKRLLPKRPDLKVVITSATFDTSRFSEYFDDAPIIEVEGRTYPVELRYRPLNEADTDSDERDIQQAIVDAVDEITEHDAHADILVFLPGEREIREATESLRQHKLRNTEVFPLFARLSVAEQNRVFKPEQKRRIILTTNVAETSLTVPRIRAVIDTGTARISRYNSRNQVQRLPIEKISQASADQRKGRCGRIAAGLCIRLYDEDDFLKRPAYTDPEILRTSLASVILQMLHLGLGDINEFPFINMPLTRNINDGFRLLLELGALVKKEKEHTLTNLGRSLAKLPIDPRLGRMILAAKEQGSLDEVLIIASALSVQDPRDRPMAAQQAADEKHKQFVEEGSDFLSFVNLWRFFHENARHLSKRKLRNLCKENFLSYRRMQEWHDIHQQVMVHIRDLGWSLNQVEADYEAIHRALLTGLLGNVATKGLEKNFIGARGQKMLIHPSSALVKKSPKWFVAAELVETSRLFARCVAKVQPEWIESIAGDVCRHEYFSPYWQARSARVGGYERVFLYQLQLVAKRRINYGAVDPKTAHEIFIREGLVNAEYRSNAPFFKHNQKLINEARQLENKLRRCDVLVSEEELFNLYATRIPEHIYTGAAFERWRKKAEQENKQQLFFSLEDVVIDSDISGEDFPDHIALSDTVDVVLRYIFDPTLEEDGVNVDIPLSVLNQIKVSDFDWLIKGLLAEKITCLIRGLPKAIRRDFVPIPTTADDALDALTFGKGDFYTELTQFLHRRRGSPLPEKWWQDIELPHYLQFYFCLRKEESGEIIAAGRDLATLQARWAEHASENYQAQMNAVLDRKNLSVWNFGDLPKQVDVTVNRLLVVGYPVLVDKATHVDMQVIDNKTEAEKIMRQGVYRLAWLNLPIKRLMRDIKFSRNISLLYLPLGNENELKQHMVHAGVNTVFFEDNFLPYQQDAFNQRLQLCNKTIGRVLADYTKLISEILKTYAEVRQLLNQNGMQRYKAYGEIKQHLNALVYHGFVYEIPFERMKHMPRYLKACVLRLQRLPQDPNKDARKAEPLLSLWEDYVQVSDKNQQQEVIDFRWQLEELRVSLFAPELKTPFSVSAQRIQAQWNKLLKSL